MTYPEAIEILPMLKRYSIVRDNGCWRYIGHSLNEDGHARVKYNGTNHYLHRLIFAIANNLDYYDKSWQANHKPECNAPNCFNPEHVYKGNQWQNNQDRSNTILKCKRGHVYDNKNSKHEKGCRICYKKYIKDYYKEVTKPKLLKQKLQLQGEK